MRKFLLSTLLGTAFFIGSARAEDVDPPVKAEIVVHAKPPHARRGASAGIAKSRGSVDWRVSGMERRQVCLAVWTLGEAPARTGNLDGSPLAAS